MQARLISATHDDELLKKTLEIDQLKQRIIDQEAKYDGIIEYRDNEKRPAESAESTENIDFQNIEKIIINEDDIYIFSIIIQAGGELEHRELMQVSRYQGIKTEYHLEELQRYKLIEKNLSTKTGRSSYLLTALGRKYAVMHRLVPRK